MYDLMIICDLHVHSAFSRDGESSIVEIIRRAETIGLDAIAITDHDTIEGAQMALAIDTDVIIIPGIEISTKQGHLIALGTLVPYPAGMDVLDTITLARSQGALLILPHPYHMWRHGVARHFRTAINAVDAVETFNSRYIVGAANRKAAKVARRLGKPAVGGSDAHNARYLGYGRTLVDASPDVQSILAAIKRGDSYATGRMTPLRTYTRQSLRNTWKKLKRRVYRRP
ncbi:MAG TPA: PHP domain-containing protein [Methanoregulaceae archaeon]|nr:PHP domain-containing protein [Methanoregulaceae archaeon]